MNESITIQITMSYKKTPFISKKYPKAHSNNRKHQYVYIFHIEENDNLSLLKYNSKMLV